MSFSVHPPIFLEILRTWDIECEVHSGTGASYYFVVENAGKRLIYEVRWDGIDYMAVARKVSWPDPDSTFRYVAVLETTWEVDEAFILAQRGNTTYEWTEHGTIVAIVLGDSWTPGCNYPLCLEELLLGN